MFWLDHSLYRQEFSTTWREYNPPPFPILLRINIWSSNPLENYLDVTGRLWQSMFDNSSYCICLCFPNSVFKYEFFKMIMEKKHFYPFNSIDMHTPCTWIFKSIEISLIYLLHSANIFNGGHSYYTYCMLTKRSRLLIIIIMLHVDIIYLACREQKYATIL